MIFAKKKNIVSRDLIRQPSCGFPDLDEFFSMDYFSIPGMSSRFAAIVSVTILHLQSEANMYGHVAEIGTFEGRFLVPLARSLGYGERAIAIDTFDWPDTGLLDRLKTRLVEFSLTGRTDIIVGNSASLQPSDVLRGNTGYGIRFFHIDGMHTKSALKSDIALAIAACEPWGVICLDDMLSPAYPEMVIAANEALDANPGWVMFCVVDREDIVASAKFMVCRVEVASYYAEGLQTAFQRNVWPMGCDFRGNKALVLSPTPRLPRFLPGGEMVET
jgi:hypothetical protein